MVKSLPKKRKKSYRFFLFLTAFCLFLALVFQGLRIYQASVWQEKGRINLVFSCQPLLVYSYSPFSQPYLLVVLVSEDTWVEVVGGYGKYRLASLPGLEALEKKRLLPETVQQALAVPIDGFIDLSSCRVDQNTEYRQFFLKSILATFWGRHKTNLTSWDLFRLLWAVKKVKVDQVKKLDLEALGVLETFNLPDETLAKRILPEKLNLKTQGFFWDEKAREEGLAIEVLNATSYPGLAESAAKVLVSLGLEVVRVGNVSQRQENCLLLTSKEDRKSYTAKRLKKIFSCQFGEKKTEEVDLSLILGEENFQK